MKKKILTIARNSACDEMYRIYPTTIADVYLKSCWRAQIWGVPEVVFSPLTAVFSENAQIFAKATGCEKAINSNLLGGNGVGRNPEKFKLSLIEKALEMDWNNIHIITNESDVLRLTNQRREIQEGHYVVLIFDEWEQLMNNPDKFISKDLPLNVSINNVSNFVQQGYKKEQIMKMMLLDDSEKQFSAIWNIYELIHKYEAESVTRLEIILEGIDEVFNAS